MTTWHIAGAVVLMLGVYHLVGPLVVSYEFRADRLQVRLFHAVPIRWVRFANIHTVRLVKLREAVRLPWLLRLLLVECWASRVFVKAVVLLKPRNAWFMHLLLTPRDPETFVAALQQRAGLSK